MWTDDDRGYALAWYQVENGKCPCGCGFQVSESTDPDNEFTFDGHAVVCFAAQARYSAVESAGDQPGVLGWATLDDQNNVR